MGGREMKKGVFICLSCGEEIRDENCVRTKYLHDKRKWAYFHNVEECWFDWMQTQTIFEEMIIE